MLVAFLLWPIHHNSILNQGPSLYADWWLGAIVVRQVQQVSCCVYLHKDRQGGHLVPQLPRM